MDTALTEGMDGASSEPQRAASQRATQRTASLLRQLRRPAAKRGSDDTAPPFLQGAAAEALDVTPPELRATTIRAAKLTGPQELSVVDGEVPALENCPEGAILVRAKYASVSGRCLPVRSHQRSRSRYLYRSAAPTCRRSA